MRKQLIPLAIGLCLGVQIEAQVMGNYAEQKKQSNEYNQQQQQLNSNVAPNAQFRSIPRSAKLQDDNSIEVTINTLSNQRASSYTAVFTILQVARTADETNTQLNNRLNSFVNDLKGLGIPETDIYIDMVNFLPKYEYDVSKKMFSKKTLTEIPKGFELQKNVHIRYSKPSILDQIVTAAAKQEIYDIVKVDYFVKEQQQVYQQLRTLSFDYLKNIKESYAKMGIHLDSAYVITAENAWVAYPTNRYESYQAFSTQSLDASEKNNSVVQPADKPTLRFYNAVAANDYDIVVNPEILEPAVQFSYNLAVRFRMPDAKPKIKTEIKKEFILVTPTGEVKSLKIE
ncbi:SIMPL domain-containing protein [Haliscomenobacter hydrossis]|uniref:SIMPL domain-containing protein n=1 Tax=Haliscomenobacter hydrossis (strain ATCC 27775 / DSM 1100 / LMG 10767 / O) TaxID=760192 RepID=F4L1G5_HALH1|nr:SIMPL domain-containing protein [Haliscomenobacter hydrossis]AEE53862.1 protein of unknown function DUF541 [Haliscomenobacter hydrossis DSM 1100]